MFAEDPLSAATYTFLLFPKLFLGEKEGEEEKEEGEKKKKSDYGKNWMIKEKRCFSTE